MKRIVIFIVLFLLTFSLAAAVEVSTNKVSYTSGETVTATIDDCQGTSIVKFINPTSDLVDIKSGQNNWQTTYNTLSDSSSSGKYTVVATCSNGPPTETNFCVDSATCTQEVTAAQENDEKKKKGAASCIPDWSCSTWSFCGPDQTQKRSCTDRNNCQAAKTETRPCAPCQESWVCSLWSDCQSGLQNRACFDEHQCLTTNYKPFLQKGCDALPLGPEPDRISFELPPPFPPAQAQVTEESFWDKYSNYIIGLVVVIVLAALIAVAIHYFKPKKVAYNINELKDWVRKEKQMGTSDLDIREILKHNTGWTDDEIDIAFESLRKAQVTAVDARKGSPA